MNAPSYISKIVSNVTASAVKPDELPTKNGIAKGS